VAVIGDSDGVIAGVAPSLVAVAGAPDPVLPPQDAINITIMAPMRLRAGPGLFMMASAFPQIACRSEQRGEAARLQQSRQPTWHRTFEDDGRATGRR